MTPIEISCLITLKDELAAQRVSVLVGAGFSLNVSSRFSNWSDLLNDATEFLFEDEIKKSFHFHQKFNSHEEANYIDYKKKELKSYINQHGYLSIISQYVKRFGHAEAIASYIEQRTPLLSRKDGKVFLHANDAAKTIIEVVEEKKLVLHKKLVNLPWNNIYTTNYDNLLESCINYDLEKELSDRILIIDKEIEGLEAQKKTIRIDQETNNKEINEQQNKVQADDTKIILDVSKNVIDPQLLKEKNRLAYEKKKNDYNLQGAIDQRNTLKLRVYECQSLVVDSSQLGIKQNKNIIKLHGSLRESENDFFGFDGDLRSHYIISEEDYEAYPKKHEAFTQLMRIALLQQSFCLIGFSGDDSNFLGWLSWVRDIIERKNKERTSSSEYKIYLISLSGNALSPEKKLLYQNHRIAYIPLGSSVCIEFLSKELDRDIDAKNYLQVLNSFLDYLTTTKSINQPQITLELLKQAELDSYWRNLPVYNIQNIKIEEVIKADLSDHNINRLPSIQTRQNSSIDVLFQLSHRLLIQAKESGLTNPFLKLIRQALNNQYIPCSLIYDEAPAFEEIFNLSRDTTEYSHYLNLAFRDALWMNNEDSFVGYLKQVSDSDTSKNASNQIIYFQILHHLFNLNFGEAKILIDKWEPTDYWIINKAGVLSIYDNTGAKQLLRHRTLPTYQNELLRVNLLLYLNFSDSFERDNNLSEKIQALKKEGLQDIQHNIEYVIDRINQTKVVVAPRGENTYYTGRTVVYSNEHLAGLALSLFGVLIETGFPTSLPSINVVNQEKLYRVVNQSFEYCPYLILYYVLLQPKEKVLRRIGQDYAFSRDIEKERNRISKNIQQSYLSSGTPERLKRNFLEFYSEFMVVLEPDEWNVFFLEVWKKLDKSGSLFNNQFQDKNEFLSKSLRYCNNAQIISQIIITCLSKLRSNQEVQHNLAVTYLYTLAQNEAIEYLKRDIGSNTELQEIITITIKSLSIIGETALFCLGNIHGLLSESHLKSIEEELTNLDLTKVKSSTFWRILIHFTHEDTFLQKIRMAVVNHSNLWNSGISNKQAMYPFDFLPLQNIINAFRRKNSFEWTPEEIKVIFDKLNAELKKIEKFLETREEIEHYEDLLGEMIAFLNQERRNLEQILEYDATLDLVRSLYHHQRGYAFILEGLLSDEKSQVVTALGELSKSIYSNKLIGHDKLIRVVVHKAMGQSQPGLFESLGYLSSWFYEFRHLTEAHVFSEELSDLIDRYIKKFPTDCDIAFVEEKLIKIAIVLKGWNIDSPAIQFFNELLATSSFLNIKYKLRYELEKSGS